MIRKVGNRYILFSKDGSRRLGDFATKAEALKREREIRRFSGN